MKVGNKKQLLKLLGTAKANHRQPALSCSSAFRKGFWGEDGWRLREVEGRVRYSLGDGGEPTEF